MKILRTHEPRIGGEAMPAEVESVEPSGEGGVGRAGPRADHLLGLEIAPFEDAHACFEAMKTWNFGFVHQVLTYSRRQAGSTIVRMKDWGFLKFSRLQIVVTHGREWLSPDEYRRCLADAERSYFQGGSYLLLLRLFETSRRFNVEVQPQLVLLQKTLLNIEGLGRELDPDLDLWATAKPYLERWMGEQIGWAGLWGPAIAGQRAHLIFSFGDQSLGI